MTSMSTVVKSMLAHDALMCILLGGAPPRENNASTAAPPITFRPSWTRIETCSN